MIGRFPHHQAMSLAAPWAVLFFGRCGFVRRRLLRVLCYIANNRLAPVAHRDHRYLRCATTSVRLKSLTLGQPSPGELVVCSLGIIDLQQSFREPEPLGKFHSQNVRGQEMHYVGRPVVIAGLIALQERDHKPELCDALTVSQY